MKAGLLTGCLRLDDSNDNSFLDFVSRNSSIHNHLSINTISKGSFDYSVYADYAETKKVLVPTRFTTVSTYRIGEKVNLVDKLTNQFLAINSGDLNEEKNFVSLVFSKVFPTITNRSAILIDWVTTQPSFIFISVDLPINFYGVIYDEKTYLVWTTENRFDRVIRDFYKDRVLIFSMPPLLNGTLVLQSLFLKKKINKWTTLSNDKLRLMSTLEAYIGRKTLLV